MRLQSRTSQKTPPFVLPGLEGLCPALSPRRPTTSPVPLSARVSPQTGFASPFHPPASIRRSSLCPTALRPLPSSLGPAAEVDRLAGRGRCRCRRRALRRRASAIEDSQRFSSSRTRSVLNLARAVTEQQVRGGRTQSAGAWRVPRSGAVVVRLRSSLLPGLHLEILVGRPRRPEGLEERDQRVVICRAERIERIGVRLRFAPVLADGFA